MAPRHSGARSLPARLVVVAVALGRATAAPAYATQVYGITDAMRATADAVLDYALTGPNATLIYDRLAYATDTFGPRLSGSAGLAQALAYVAATAAADGLVVSTQAVTVPNWKRGTEWATMVLPRNKSLHFLGLGGSNGTGGQVVTGPVMVVRDRAELDARSTEVRGKIVVFNPPWVSYGANVGVRSGAATWVAAYGGLAALVKAVGPWGLQTPHTGGSTTAAVPGASISMEDATQMKRMVDRGQQVVVSLYMESHFEADAPSMNVLIDLPGSELPNEYVVIGGHGDSWDVAEGAMDDGGGAFAGWHAVRMLSILGIKPRRTVRAVVWTNEENGGAGGTQYALQAAATLNATSIAIENDEGAFAPFALSISGHPGAVMQARALAPLLARIGAGNVTTGGSGADIGPMCRAGVPCAAQEVLDFRLSPGQNNPCAGMTGAFTPDGSPPFDDGYFWIHHSSADTIDRMDPAQLQLVAASMAVWAVTIANLPELLQRTGDTPAPLPGAPGGGVPVAAIAGGVSAACIVAAGAVAGLVFRRRRLAIGAGGRAAGFTSGGAYADL